MSLEENKAIVRRFVEAYNKKNLDLFDELFAPDYVDHTLHIRGLESLKQNWARSPTGKQFKTISVEIYRISNGKIVEGWTFLDWFTHLEFSKQQGVVEYKGYPEEGLF